MFPLCLVLTLFMVHGPLAGWSNTHIQQSTPVTLEVGKSIDREIAAGESHSYTLNLAAGQYARILVEQRSLNLAFSVTESLHNTTFDSDLYPIGETELVSLAPAEATTFTVVVKPLTKAGKGSYTIRIGTLRPAVDQDKSAIAGERLISDALVLITQPGPESQQKAIAKYSEATALFKEANQPAWQATALYLTASSYFTLRDKQKAFEFSDESFKVAETAFNVTGPDEFRLAKKVKAVAENVRGQIELDFGNRIKALDYFTQSLALNREIKERAKEVESLSLLAFAHEAMGNYNEALTYLQQMAAVQLALGDRNKDAYLYNNFCVVSNDLGNYRAATDYCNQALAIRREMSDQFNEAVTLGNLGIAFASLGEYQKALDAYNQAYAIHKTMGRLQSQAILLNNIAWVYGTLGEQEKAIPIYQQAADILRGLGDKYREANALSNIAVNYANLKDYRKALDLNLQLLPVRREINDKEGQVTTLNSIANCYSNLNEKPKALEYLNQAVEISHDRNPRTRALVLRNLGNLHRELGQFDKAVEYLNEGLNVTRRIGDRNGEAATLSAYAQLERDRGNLTAAQKRIEDALAAVESLRINVQSQSLRASYFASVRSYHELSLDLLMRLHQQNPTAGYDALALQVGEKGRARSLLEMLAEAKAEIRQGVDQQLVDRERMLRQKIADEADKQTRLLSGPHTEAQVSAAAKQLDAMTTEYEQVQASIREASPRYAAITQPVPIGLKEIQTLLDEETVLLEYSLGEAKSFLWAVSTTGMKSFELPKRAEIETVAKRVYDDITATSRVVPGEDLVQRQRRLDQADADFQTAATALSKVLLDPVANELKNKRLLIVGEGVLQYIPFAALPEPATASVPLITNHEVVSLPSASVLGLLRHEVTRRSQPAKSIAVFADPVFDANDSRMVQPSQHKVENINAALRDEMIKSAAESGLNSFVRLPFTRQEADQIMRFAGTTQSFKEVDFGASRQRAIGADLRHYRIVHFATHGIVNNQHAELSGIVLSLVDEQGRPQNGFLRLYDIYNLNLNADLVVLSACQTALGKDIKGEGLVGLTRAFMYAGASRVVASLWQIDDRGTAELMSYFYQAMLSANLSPAAALRKAQLTMLNNKRWRHPRYWAAFTIQGEWK